MKRLLLLVALVAALVLLTASNRQSQVSANDPPHEPGCTYVGLEGGYWVYQCPWGMIHRPAN